MPRLSSCVGYEFTSSSGFDYNYDPVDGKTSSSKTESFDPYSDYYNPYSNDIPTNSQAVPIPRSLTPPLPTTPDQDPSYILQSTNPSIPLTNPANSRKLLILDLNGTLVFRSPHRPRPAHRFYRYQPSHHENSPPIRTVHPRPYMSSFTSYIFHTTTRSWLDTMIWSSAQPHSVADMVTRCFGQRKHELVAVWARDTLGLEEKDYHRKIQTTKDLAKPWAALPLRTNSNSNSNSDSGTTTRSSPFPTESQPQPQAHSAHTTLLLDDSPLKAHLQPWNHLCIREYNADERSADLALQERERTLRKRREDAERSTSSSISYPSSEEKEADVASIGTGSKNRKYPKKKSKNLQTEPEEDGKKYDQSLLAVIGILDALKHESNVAGWIRSGRMHVRPSSTPSRENGATVNLPYSPPPPDTITHPEIPVPGLNASIPDPLDNYSQKEHTPTPQAQIPTRTPKPTLTEAQPQAQWYEDPETVAYWVERGLRALHELGIEVVVGVDGGSEN
ncbi:hypothetical protein L208DRAFT_1364208 [Tricholoma matsutake]|nr:hypothetical protein L208DRAFT_1364208 [Tricholoma matsutake 945]